MSRSRLFALAVPDFLKRQRDEQVLARLNEVYAKGTEPSEKRLLKDIKAKVRHAMKERWSARFGKDRCIGLTSALRQARHQPSGTLA